MNLPTLNGIVVTGRQFAYFEARCGHWADLLGLKDWIIDAQLSDIDTPAAVELMQDSHSATIHLNRKQAHSPKDAYLNRVALHECLHIMLCDLVTLARSRTVLENEIEWVQHAIIRRLESVLL